MVKIMARPNAYLREMDMVRFSASLSCIPQNRDAIIDEPCPSPMHANEKILINWLARDTADSDVSPRAPTMMLSIILTPVVIRHCRVIGMARFSVFL